MSPDGSLRHIRILDERAVFMAAAGRNDYSQFGEDGLIEALLDRVGAENRWCFEVGAADGVFYSNTKRLREQGWRSVLIEENKEQFDKLMACGTGLAILVNQKVDRDGLDRILDVAEAPVDMDLGVIDVDGQDYWLWEGMTKYKPRVVLIEFAYNADGNHVPPPGDGQSLGAGIDAMRELGAKKGYTLLAKTYCNLLFCRRELLA